MDDWSRVTQIAVPFGSNYRVGEVVDLEVKVRGVKSWWRVMFVSESHVAPKSTVIGVVPAEPTQHPYQWR